MIAESLPCGWQERSPKQVAAIVLLILMAMVLSFVELPVVPGAEWLKYDPSGIVSLLATILYGSWIGVAVAVTSWIPHLVTDPLGAFMNIMATVSLILVVGTVYRRKPCLMHAVLGCAAGVVVSSAVSICLNFVVTAAVHGRHLRTGCFAGVAGIAAVQRGQGAGELRRSHRIVPQAGFVAGGTGRQPFQLRPKSLLTLRRNSLE